MANPRAIRHTTGSRTRRVINLANPGSTIAAYNTKTAILGIPSLATDGVPNFHSQKTLHIVVQNNGLMSTNGTPQPMALVVNLYIYNSSLGGLWERLSIPMSKGTGAGVLEFYDVEATIAKDDIFRTQLPIEGAERIAVSTSFSGGNSTRGAGDYSIWLGANSI